MAPYLYFPALHKYFPTHRFYLVRVLNCHECTDGNSILVCDFTPLILNDELND